mmetsp:Transcript_55557/g.89832  ORF Transcript_55557/g.89832 Transcript_55557/m.89832 type:complete len:95 (+) Transcript_55557:157-441(+)
MGQKSGSSIGDIIGPGFVLLCEVFTGHLKANSIPPRKNPEPQRGDAAQLAAEVPGSFVAMIMPRRYEAKNLLNDEVLLCIRRGTIAELTCSPRP